MRFCFPVFGLLGFLHLVAASITTRADSVVVFNEIMYHPPSRESALEWVELHNQMAVDVDLSGWSITGGIQYRFAEGTRMAGGGYLVIAASPPEIMSTMGLTNVLGPFTGRLGNGGDRLELRNNSYRLMDAVSYGVEDEWPAGADGAGMSLAKKDENTSSALAKNWTVSALAGGTPGRRNFAATPFEVISSTPLAMNSSWRYEFSQPALENGRWKQVDFDDSAWAQGTGPFRAGSPEPPLGDSQPVPTVFSSGVDANGAALAPGARDPHYLITQSAQRLPSPLPVAATVIQNHPSWTANDRASSWIGPVNPGSSSVAAGNYYYRTSFSLDGFDPASAVLSLSVCADNRLNEVLLNGIPQGIQYVGFSSPSSIFTLKNGFVAGTNWLDFQTANDSTTDNPAGFRAVLRGAARQQVRANTTWPVQTNSSFLRARFVLNGSPGMAALRLNAVVADGAVFYLNGQEVLRVNMPLNLSSPALARSNVIQPLVVGPVLLSPIHLIAGTNLLAAEVCHGPGGGTNLLFAAQLSLDVTNVVVPPPVSLAFNEMAPVSLEGSWVELLNYGKTPINLDGYILARHGNSGQDNCALPRQALNPGSFVTLTQAALGFELNPADRLFLFPPERTSVIDAAVVKAKPSGRWPDGAGPWGWPSVSTPGRSNEFLFHHDVVINEIMYHAPPATVQVVDGSASSMQESWLELYNRGGTDLDLTGWRLAGDIAFDFTAGTVIPAKGYLVVAKEVEFMRTQYPERTMLGPFRGNMKHSGSRLLLLDGAENIADEVQYGDSKPWPFYADGGGSSLELRDPWADNSRPEAWAASQEQARSAWSNYTYRAVAATGFGPTRWKEFVIGLLDAGECLLDDIEVVESPAGAPVEMLQNGDFESGLSSWRALGNHQDSRVETDPDNPSNHVLHLVATGPTEHLHNHLETTLAGDRSVVTGREYKINFRAKWLAGNPRLNTRLYFNRLARTTALARPALRGTPGAPNSTSSANIGPTFLNLNHRPVIPKANEAVTVSVQVGDPQEVRNVVLWWSVNQLTWNQAIMSELEPDSTVQPGYVKYQAIIPGQSPGTLVQFFIQATDDLDALSIYPAAGVNSRALYRVDDGRPVMPQLHRLRLLMTPGDVQRLHAPTNVMSNERLGLTLVYDEQEVYYDVGLHLQSSERGRNESTRVGYSVRFNAGQLFRDNQKTITIDRSGGYSGRGSRQDEILLWHAVNHAGGLLGFNCDLVQCFAPRLQEDGPALLRMSAFDGGYFDGLFKDGAEGNLYTLELIYYPTTTVNGNPQAPKLPQPDEVVNTDIQNWGNDPEGYRWIFLQENHAEEDDYSQIMALNKAFSLTGASLETQVGQLMDMDEWMRTLAFKAFTGDADTFTFGLNHNWKIYFRPTDGKALGLLWDMDFAFSQPANYAPLGSGSPNMLKIARLPGNYRRFYQHLLDIASTTVNAQYLAPWSDHYSRLLGQDWSGLAAYLQQRTTYLLGTMPLATPFRITTQGGRDFEISSNIVLLAGTAPLAINQVTLNGSVLPMNWTSLTNWTMAVPLLNYTNRFILQGVDIQGHSLSNAMASVSITNLLAAPVPPHITAVQRSLDGVVSISVKVNQGRSYRVEYCSDLNTSTWIALGSARKADGPLIMVTDQPALGSQRYYRVVLLP